MSFHGASRVDQRKCVAPNSPLVNLELFISTLAKISQLPKPTPPLPESPLAMLIFASIKVPYPSSSFDTEPCLFLLQYVRYYAPRVCRAGEDTNILGERVGPVHQQELHRVEVVEIAGLVQRSPAEVVLLVLVAPGVQEELTDLCPLCTV